MSAPDCLPDDRFCGICGTEYAPATYYVKWNVTLPSLGRYPSSHREPCNDCAQTIVELTRRGCLGTVRG